MHECTAECLTACSVNVQALEEEIARLRAELAAEKERAEKAEAHADETDFWKDAAKLAQEDYCALKEKLAAERGRTEELEKAIGPAMKLLEACRDAPARHACYHMSEAYSALLAARRESEKKGE